MSESGGGGDSNIPSTTTSPTPKVAAAVAAASPTPSPAPRTTTPPTAAAAAPAAAAAGGDTAKDDLEAQQKEWMEDFLRNSKKLTIADFMNMFMHIRMRQEHMRGDEQYAANIAVHPNHYIRNRYRDILPYDKNRVCIATSPAENAEGYVNASSVSLPQGLTTFIAAQAPLPQTLDDFWQMVDEQGVKLVVMLCKLVEMSKVKCERYWPEAVGATEVYGNYEITLDKEERFDDDEYLLRTLKMRNVSGGTERTVHQLHYKEWPDHGCPTGSSQLLNMVDRMAELAGSLTLPSATTDAAAAAAATTTAATANASSPGGASSSSSSNGNGSPAAERPPVLVHCSAGVGRTGTIILINHIRELILQKLCIDVNLLAMVVALREQRSSMVQTQDQFQFVHRCVVTYCRRALGLPEIEDGGEMPPPPPYVQPRAPPAAAVDGGHAPSNQRQREREESEEDEEAEEETTAAPDYPDEPSRTPRGPEDVNSSC
ncbi:hypothetical protein PENTCL1PPCAC_18973 [Pristionchus entomophagus]|uniref:Tyrosine phosphatase n=1 Tax=Pristionchus entomophagus TaxID=358040 RepID=A0AAV5TRX6_9BILA|nr:hypothetical protein PENTCL1PPCAC_18973 [Pristionchus entomophagus]